MNKILKYSVITLSGLTIVAGFCGGCASSKMPPRLNPSQQLQIDNQHFNCVVAVEPYQWPVYSDSLVSALQRTTMFDDVGLLTNTKHFDVVAKVEEPVHGTAAIPVFTLLSLGIIPTIVEEDHGHVFSLAAQSYSSNKYVVSTKYSGNSILGWLALPAGLLPSYTYSNPETTDRYNEYLKYQLISSANEILSSCKKYKN